MASSFDRLRQLELTGDEIDRLSTAFKREEFRQLFADYIDEIQDPNNRQVYEEEIKQLERERGQEVTFLHPTPGYVIKTSINGNLEGFINICSNSNIDKFSSIPCVKNGEQGFELFVPHSLSPPRDELDDQKVSCQVFDVLFHPDSLQQATRDKIFQYLLNDTALDAIEKNFNVQLDRNNLTFPKISYKGTKRACIMRNQSKCEPLERDAEEKKLFDKLYADIDNQRHANANNNQSSKTNRAQHDRTHTDSSPYTIPVYTIIHRNYVDIQEFAEDKNAKLNAAIPKELVIEINLPLLKCSSDMHLDVTEKTVELASEKPAKYKLNLTLPYHVIEANGKAKFSKNDKKLTITLPVKRNTIHCKYDSGIDSDLNSPSYTTLNSGSFDNNALQVDMIETNNDNIKSNNASVLNPLVNQSNLDDFLKSNEAYSLPEFKTYIFKFIAIFTFDVKNVDEKSVHKVCVASESLIKIKFASVSSSFYITNYSFYLKFPNHKYMENNVSIETWDNNVILQVPLVQSVIPLTSFFYGSNGMDFIEKFFTETNKINRYLEKDSITDAMDRSNKIEDIYDDFFDLQKYILPEFTCNCTNGIFTFIFNVENIIEKSICKEYLIKKSAIKIKFNNSSDVNCNYAFYLWLPHDKYLVEQITIETCVNTMIMKIPLKKNYLEFVSYYYGLNQESVMEKSLHEKPTIVTKLLLDQQNNDKQLKNQFDSSNKTEMKNRKKENLFEIKQSKAVDIPSHSYESSSDDLNVGSSSPGKSILKRMINYQTKFGRSISESSVDDVICSSYENHYNNEGAVDEISSSLKKTVRFNDVISKQLFRSNSSILGQRKKNQRKARNKKHVNENRCSESETSDVDNKKEEEKTRSKSSKNKRERSKIVQENEEHYDENEDIFNIF